MVSSRRNTPERQRFEALFTGMEPKLRAVYDRMHKQEMAYREQLFNRYTSFLINGIPDSRGRSVATGVARGWMREKQIFAFHHRRHYHFPSFQFSAGEPKPVVGKALALMNPDDGWHAMFWFVGANGWLEAGAPVEILDADPRAVLEAAMHANDEISD